MLLLALVAVLVWPRGATAGEPIGAPIAVGDEPVALEEGGGAVWVANSRDGTVTRIDQATGTTRSINVGGAPTDLAFERGALWIYNYSGALTRIDAATEASTRVYFPPGQTVDIENGGGYVWVTGAVPDTVLRINATSNAIDQFRVPGGPSFMVYGNDRLYLTTSGPPALATLDPASGQVLGTMPIAGESGGVDLVDGTLYVGVSGPPGPDGSRSFTITPVDERSQAVGAPIAVDRAAQVVFGAGSYWAAYPVEDELRRYSLSDRTQVGEPLRGVGKGVAWMQLIEGRLWVLDATDRTVTRYDIDS